MQHSSRRYQTPPLFGSVLWSVSSSIRHDVMSVQQHLCRLASNFEYATFYVLYSWPPAKRDKYITYRSIAKREPSHGHRYIACRGNLVKVWTCDCGNVRADINTERQTDTLIAILRSRIDRAAEGTEFLPHTHPIPTENPVGITTRFPYPENPKILHTHTRTLSFHYKRYILICCLSHWQLVGYYMMYVLCESVCD